MRMTEKYAEYIRKNIMPTQGIDTTGYKVVECDCKKKWND